MRQILLPPPRKSNFYKFDPICFRVPKEGLFRGPTTQISCPEEKEHGEIRIICVGDSVTYGVGLSYDKTWPYLLKRLLKNKFPHKNIKVMNAAFPGSSPRQVKRIFQVHLVKYNPDIVIFRDDFTGLTDSYEVPETSNIIVILKAQRYLWRGISKSSIFRVICILADRENKGHLASTRVYDFIMRKPFSLKKNLGHKFDSDFSMLKKIASEHGIKYVIAVDCLGLSIGVVSPQQLSKLSLKGTDIESSCLQYTNKGLGPVVCTYNAFKEKLKSVPINELFIDQEHLTEMGTSIVAQEIFKFLLAEKWIESICDSTS